MTFEISTNFERTTIHKTHLVACINGFYYDDTLKMISLVESQTRTNGKKF